MKDCDGVGVEGRGFLLKVVSFVILRLRLSWFFIEDKEVVTKIYNGRVCLVERE